MPPASPLAFILRALKYRNYRLFFIGQIVSLIGSWLTIVATSWLVYRLTGKATWLGIVGFAAQIPMFLLSPFAGVWVDRFSRHKLLLVTQSLSMLQSLALAYLTLTHRIHVSHVILLNLFQGIVNAFDVPARQAFTVEMVENREDLSNAIALSSSMVHSARLLGPTVAGILIATVGEGWCFLIDGFSYLAVLGALLAMVVPRTQDTREHAHPIKAFNEGFRYAFGFPPMRALLLLCAVVSFVAMSQQALLPIFAGKILAGSAKTYGFLMTASGCGALLASIYLASRRTVIGLGRVIAVAGVALGAGLMAFSLSRLLPLSLSLLFVTGGAMVLLMASANTVLQTITDDDKRGRVMSLFTMAFGGMAPWGALLGGKVADHFGAPATLCAAGAIALLAGLAFARVLPSLRPHIRPIYEKKGILMDLQASTESSVGAGA